MMISYEVYKILHLFTLMMLMSSLGIVLGEGRWIPNRTFKITMGVFSFLAFVAGMGLIARLGFKHNEPFPLWIWIKFISWFLINIVIVAGFRLQSKKAKAGLAIMGVGILFVAITAAVSKWA